MGDRSLKFSIVTPVYNSEEVILDLILSILDQDYDNWELVIQDGGSRDRTVEIVSSLNDSRIKIHSEKDEGMYDALNKAISKSNGDFIIHLNSDEQMVEGALKSIANEILEKPGFEVYCFGVIVIDKDRNPRVFRAAYPQKKLFIKLFNLDILTAGIVYKADIFQKLKFDTYNKAVSDALLFIDLVDNYKIFYSQIYSSFFLIEGENLSLEERAVKERDRIKSSVFLSSLTYFVFYYPRKLLKLFYRAGKYTGPKRDVNLYKNGKKISKSVENIIYKLSWDEF